MGQLPGGYASTFFFFPFEEGVNLGGGGGETKGEIKFNPPKYQCLPSYLDIFRQT